jgi:hypothetical protein
MGDEIGPMNITRNLLICLIILFISVSFQPVLFAQDTQTTPEVSEEAIDGTSTENIEKEPISPPAKSSGLKVYIDPETGEFLDSPPEKMPAEIQRTDEEAISTSIEELEQREVDLPGGGVMMDLKGRFHQYQTATKDADGNITIRCTPNAPAPTENNETDTHQIPSHDDEQK